jgi:hypothetical protein
MKEYLKKYLFVSKAEWDVHEVFEDVSKHES